MLRPVGTSLGEQRFPLIVFLKGNLTNFRWLKFCENLGYSTNWNPAGQTYRVQHDRVITSPFVDDEGLIRAVAGQPIPLEPAATPADVPFQDPSELDFYDEEGHQVLREHLYRERSVRLLRKFKRSLVDFSCRVCGFNFKSVYGEQGSGFIEAHHTKPLAELEPGATVQDLLAVCSNCHRMLHRGYPTTTPQMLRDLITQSFANRA